MNGVLLVAMIAGAVLTFAIGVWIGLGRPGMKDPVQQRPWRSDDRLRATWINRVFFRMDQRPRRFDTSRLVVPKSKPDDVQQKSEEEENSGLVRLRRRGG